MTAPTTPRPYPSVRLMATCMGLAEQLHTRGLSAPQYGRFLRLCKALAVQPSDVIGSLD